MFFGAFDIARHNIYMQIASSGLSLVTGSSLDSVLVKLT